jgi:hypothetical protein
MPQTWNISQGKPQITSGQCWGLLAVSAITELTWSRATTTKERKHMRCKSHGSSLSELTSKHTMPQISDMKLQDSVFALVRFSLALIRSFLAVLLFLPFWNENVYSLSLYVGSTLTFFMISQGLTNLTNKSDWSFKRDWIWIFFFPLVVLEFELRTLHRHSTTWATSQDFYFFIYLFTCLFLR